MNNKIIMPSIMIAAMVVLSFAAKAQDTALRNYNRMQMDTMHGNNKMIDPDSGYNKKDYNNKNQMNHNPHQKNQNDTMVLQNNKKQPRMNSDYIMMQNGKLVMMKDGNAMPMNKDMTLKNRTVLMVNGKYKMKDGSTRMMKEGDRMDMNGKMITEKTSTYK